MNTAAFVALMLIVLFGFVAAMIWAYRRSGFEDVKPKEEAKLSLNNFDDTLKTITTYTAEAQKEIEEKEKAAQEKTQEEENAQDPLLKIETESRKKMMQDKNHIKKSAADEYFERTKTVANEILQKKK